MAKKITKIGDKLEKVSDSFSVQMYDNGFMLEISGKNKNNDWSNAKLMCSDLAQLIDLIKEATELPKED